MVIGGFFRSAEYRKWFEDVSSLKATLAAAFAFLLLWTAVARGAQSSRAKDWNLGPEAHPCDLKSSTDVSGRVRSGYVPPPIYVA